MYSIVYSYLRMVGGCQSSLDAQKTREQIIQLVIKLSPIIRQDDMRKAHVHEQLHIIKIVTTINKIVCHNYYTCIIVC